MTCLPINCFQCAFIRNALWTPKPPSISAFTDHPWTTSCLVSNGTADASATGTKMQCLSLTQTSHFAITVHLWRQQAQKLVFICHAWNDRSLITFYCMRTTYVDRRTGQSDRENVFDANSITSKVLNLNKIESSFGWVSGPIFLLNDFLRFLIYDRCVEAVEKAASGGYMIASEWKNTECT